MSANTLFVQAGSRRVDELEKPTEWQVRALRHKYCRLVAMASRSVSKAFVNRAHVAYIL
jgi:hypothetical protein